MCNITYASGFFYFSDKRHNGNVVYIDILEKKYYKEETYSRLFNINDYFIEICLGVAALLKRH